MTQHFKKKLVLPTFINFIHNYHYQHTVCFDTDCMIPLSTRNCVKRNNQLNYCNGVLTVLVNQDITIPT